MNKYINTVIYRHPHTLARSFHIVLIYFLLNFIYFTTITRQVIQLILIMLVGTDVCTRLTLVYEKQIVFTSLPTHPINNYDFVCVLI